MANEWGPLSFQTSTLPNREIAWPTGSVIPIDVDDQAPIPLIVGIALAIVIGFVIIVFCICRRHNLLGGASSSTQDSNSAYQRAPTGDGTGGAFNTGVGGNSYPMAPVKPMYPPGQGQQPVVGLPGKAVPGGMNACPKQAPSHPYPSLPPDAYTPPYPLGYAPLPSYMPTTLSSHPSSVSGPCSDQGPTGLTTSTAASSMTPSTTGGMLPSNAESTVEAPGGPAAQSRLVGSELKSEDAETGVAKTPAGTPGLPPPGMMYTGQGHYGYVGQGGQGMGIGQAVFQTSMMNQRGMMGAQGMGGGGKGPEMNCEGDQTSYPPTIHPTAMDYVPNAGIIPRVGSPMPPGVTVTELDQL